MGLFPRNVLAKLRKKMEQLSDIRKLFFYIAIFFEDQMV